MNGRTDRHDYASSMLFFSQFCELTKKCCLSLAFHQFMSLKCALSRRSDLCSTSWRAYLTLILLTWTKWRATTNASKWRMGFNSAFKALTSLSSATIKRPALNRTTQTYPLPSLKICGAIRTSLHTHPWRLFTGF